MTRRERLEAVINGEITEELIKECKRELEKLNAHSAAANERAKTTKNYVENKEYEKLILEVLSDEPKMIDEIAELTGIKVSRQRLTAICTNLVREGHIRAVEVKVKGKGKRRAYIVQVRFFISWKIKMKF